MVIARLEALIAGQGEKVALERAKAYIEDGGADGIWSPIMGASKKSPIHHCVSEV